MLAPLAGLAKHCQQPPTRQVRRTGFDTSTSVAALPHMIDVGFGVRFIDVHESAGSQAGHGSLTSLSKNSLGQWRPCELSPKALYQSHVLRPSSCDELAEQGHCRHGCELHDGIAHMPCLIGIHMTLAHVRICSCRGLGSSPCSVFHWNGPSLWVPMLQA